MGRDKLRHAFSIILANDLTKTVFFLAHYGNLEHILVPRQEGCFGIGLLANARMPTRMTF